MCLAILVYQSKYIRCSNESELNLAKIWDSTLIKLLALMKFYELSPFGWLSCLVVVYRLIKSISLDLSCQVVSTSIVK
jgi:hypothetical protein